jgi:hypothetical protein
MPLSVLQWRVDPGSAWRNPHVGGFEAWLEAGLPVAEAPEPGDGLPGMDSPA